MRRPRSPERRRPALGGSRQGGEYMIRSTAEAPRSGSPANVCACRRRCYARAAKCGPRQRSGTARAATGGTRRRRVLAAAPRLTAATSRTGSTRSPVIAPNPPAVSSPREADVAPAPDRRRAIANERDRVSPFGAVPRPRGANGQAVAPVDPLSHPAVRRDERRQLTRPNPGPIPGTRKPNQEDHR